MIHRPIGAIACASAIVGCAPPEIPPIELDLSTNCAAVEAEVVVPGVQSPARPWTRVFAVLADRPGKRAAWVLAAYEPIGVPTVGMFHLDEQGAVDRQWDIGVAVAQAGGLALVAGATPGSVFVTERREAVFTARRFEVTGDSPLAAVSPNLAAMAVPCDEDGDENFGVCDASGWHHTLIMLGGQPYALTFPPASGDFTVELTPTLLDAFLTPTITEGRTLDFRPSCDSGLPGEDFLACEAELAERTYPTLSLAGLQGSDGGGLVALSLYREVQIGTDPITVADAPLFRLAIDDLGRPRGELFVDQGLPEPRDATPRGVALDSNAAYMHFVSITSEAVLVRVRGDVFERLDQVYSIAPDAQLAQLDRDVAMHRLVDGAWEVLKLFPDAPDRSETLVYEAEAAIEAVEAAGPGTFLLRTTDGLADLVHLRCVLDDAT